jgi:hypothetical protein
MIKGGHLWAIGFDDMEQAKQVRAEIARLGERSFRESADLAGAC